MQIKTFIVLALGVALSACAALGGGDPELYQALGQTDVRMASRLVQTTLDTTPDGATRSWVNEQTGNRGAITPTRTYLTGNGHICRDYREELSVGEKSGRYLHTACRDPDEARWIWR